MMRKLLIVVVAVLATAFQLWFTSPSMQDMESVLDGKGGYGSGVLATMEGDMNSPNWRAPFAYRMLTPAMVSAVVRTWDIPIQEAARTVQVAGMFSFLISLALLLGAVARKTIPVLLILVAVSFSYAVRFYAMFPPVYAPDPWTLSFLTLCVMFILQRRWGWYGIVMLIGALNRETQIFMIPVALSFVAFRFKDLAKVFAFSTPAVLSTLLLRVLIPVNGRNFLDFYLKSDGGATTSKWALASQGGSKVLITSFLVFGVLWVVAAFGSLNFNPESRMFWAMVLVAHLQVLMTIDTRRLVAIAVPVVALKVYRVLSGSSVWIWLGVVSISVIHGWRQFGTISRLRFGWMAGNPIQFGPVNLLVGHAEWVGMMGFASFLVLLLLVRSSVSVQKPGTIRIFTPKEKMALSSLNDGSIAKA